jgi:hypothetical protein
MSEQLQQARVENIASSHEFENLLNFTADACLRDPNLFHTNLRAIAEHSRGLPNQELLQRIGLWPVRNIFDSYPAGALPTDIEGRFTKPEITMANKTLANVEVMPPDKAIQDKIEALGQSIIDEAFITLGPDAQQKVTDYKNAQTREEKQAVFEWLNQRIIDIRDKFKDPNIDEELDDDVEEINDYVSAVTYNFFHPARLSPRLIGEYPQTHLSPTCLGISILAASFCEKLGVKYMHGGVMTTGIKAVMSTQRKLLPQVARIINQQWSLKAPQKARERFNDAIQNNMIGYELNRGFHADVVAEIEDDVWIQIDPNFRSTLILENGVQLQQVYEALSQTGIRGMEKLVYNDRRAQEGSPADFIRRLVKKSPSVGEIEDFLMKVPIKDADVHLVKKYFGDFFDKKSKSSECVGFYSQKILDSMLVFDPSWNLDPDVSLFMELREAVLEYVFEGDEQEDHDFDEYLIRCKKDPAYRRKVAKYLKIAPLLAVLKLQSSYAHSVDHSHTPEPHAMTELGLPAYRIGACVLSDFAVHCGDNLPFSFWATYWPSHIIFREHFDQISSKSQIPYAQTVARKIINGGLTYNDVYIRVK